MVGDAAANAAIAWLSRDSFIPILSRRSKPLHEKMTCQGVVCGIADILVATLATAIQEKLFLLDRIVDGRDLFCLRQFQAIALEARWIAQRVMYIRCSAQA